MARPIEPTPVLKGREATKFITMVHRDAQKPAGLIPTPKLKKAQKLIQKLSENG